MAFKSANGLLSTRMIWVLASVAALALQAALIVTHLPWSDEYQAVQIAVQATDIPALLDWLRYEGHPPLWYLLLRGLAHFVEPLDTLWMAALLLAIPTQALILFASPFARAQRLCIALSEFMLFDFLTISRSQTLGVAVLVLSVVLWQKRPVWLAIALLPLCDFLFGIFSGIFILLKWQEKSLHWPGVALWFTCALLAAWTIWPAADMVNAFDALSITPGLNAWFTMISGLFIPFQGGIFPQWNTPVAPVASIAWIGFLALCWIETKGEPFHRLVLFGLIAITLAFTITLYPLGLRHLMLIALLLILLAWLKQARGQSSSPFFQFWLALIALCGLGTAAINLTRPFDTAHHAIAEIRERGLIGKHWMVFPDWRLPALSAQSGMRFERPEQHCMLDFVIWNHKTKLLDPQRMTEYLRAEISRHGRSYLISDQLFSAIPKEVLTPITTVSRGYDGLEYHLYVVGPEADERPVELPDCVAPKRPLKRL